MARRKRGILDDDDDDDSSEATDGSELGEEGEGYVYPNSRNKRRKFGEDSDEEVDIPRRGVNKKRRDPVFISKAVDGTDSESANSDGVETGVGGENDEEDSEEDDEELEEEILPPLLPPLGVDDRIQEPELESSALPSAFSGFSKGGIGSTKAKTSSGGIGFSKGGIGSGTNAPSFARGDTGSRVTLDQLVADDTTTNDEPNPANETPPTSLQWNETDLPSNLPSSFGTESRTQRSFIRNGSHSNLSKPKTPLSNSDMAQFYKLQGSFGARMLEKMGWQAGGGLGVTGEGIATPVESKLRPGKIGIAFKGFKEKTEQSRKEAVRRGEAVSDDEDRPKARKGKGKVAKADKGSRSDVWKKPQKSKVKIVHKTYEEIVAEAGSEGTSTGIGMIIDATGATPREVSSLAEVSAGWTPSSDPTRIPEVRHNLRLISEGCKTDLDGLAREAKTLQERKTWVANEDIRLRKNVEEEADLISRLQQIHLVADEISSQSKELSSAYEASLELFSPIFSKLINQFPREFEKYRLDEIVVAAIAPLVRRMVSQWKPLDDPSSFISTFRDWRPALKMNVEEKPELKVDVYGRSESASVSPQVEKLMTPFESLLWNVWLPKVRSTINNDWQPSNPTPAVKLYEVWSAFLPPFIRDNFLDQLILPKVHKAVSEWNPKDGIPLQTLVFPWLPHVGLRLEDLLGDARRKFKGLLRSWVVGEPVPGGLTAWKDVFDINEWDNMILKHIVPKLGATLRDDFKVNPRNQVMEPIMNVLLWCDIIRPSIFSQLLETEFFPKWLDVLHIWLIQPKVSFEEVAQWYSFWKSAMPENVLSLPGVSRGFTRGLQHMNKAIELGPEAPSLLPKPDYRAEMMARNSSVNAPTTAKAKQPVLRKEITFRAIVEEFAGAHDLLFIPSGQAHEKSRMPLFKVSPSLDGRKGLLVYVLDDAVWAPNADGDYRVISLEEMVQRASA